MLSILKSIKFELRSLHSVYGLNLLFSPEDSKNHAMNNFKKIVYKYNNNSDNYKSSLINIGKGYCLLIQNLR